MPVASRIFNFPDEYEIRRARERGIPPGVVLADAGYGTDSGFRTEVTKLEMTYVVGRRSRIVDSGTGDTEAIRLRRYGDFEPIGETEDGSNGLRHKSRHTEGYGNQIVHLIY